MKILVLNAGSSSLKFKLYDMTDESVIAEGNCQRVGLPDSEIKYANGKKITLIEQLDDHGVAMQKVIELLTSGDTKVIGSMAEIAAVGHRVSMGGPKYRQTALITEDVISTVEQVSDIVPLHNPPQAKCIRACRKLFGNDFPMAAGFDTAYHQTIPEKAYLYGIPREYYEKYGIRRYGFHGLSYQFVVGRYNELTGGGAEREKLVVCHLGGGASLTAIVNGESIDNTFGFGTGEGPVCGTRAGTFDHVAIGYLMDKSGMTYAEVEAMLHKESGIFGLSGISSDERELEEAAEKGNARAQLALDVMSNQIIKYIGSYAFEMGGVDTIIFTGGIGENSDIMRAMVCKNLGDFGIRLDVEANVRFNRTEHEISAADSKVKLWVIPTNEELVIAQDTYRLVAGK